MPSVNSLKWISATAAESRAGQIIPGAPLPQSLLKHKARPADDVGSIHEPLTAVAPTEGHMAAKKHGSTVLTITALNYFAVFDVWRDPAKPARPASTHKHRRLGSR